MNHKLVLNSALLLGSIAVSACSVGATTSPTYKINAASAYGTWDGWGTSLAWWAKAFGNRDDLADLAFTTNSVTLNGVVLPGLGLNIVRYNAGASTSSSYNGLTMKLSSSMDPNREMDGYWLDGYSNSPLSASWNWAADLNQRTMMQKAKLRGANIFELFSNSPIWWMTVNQDPQGAANGGANLQNSYLDQHAVYLATIAKYAQTNWGITFNSVEAFNEPSSNWWSTANSQEGCFIGASTQQSIIAYLRSELNNQGLANVMVSASDENTYDQATTTWQSISGAAKAQVGRFNVHGYQYAGGRRDLLAAAVAPTGQKIWNSEYGDGDASGQELIDSLMLDFSYLHPSGWVYWQVLDYGGWGAIQSNLSSSSFSTANTKYYVMAQFTRHIRPGMKIIANPNSTGSMVSAYDPVAHQLIIVAANAGKTSQTMHFDLTAFKTVSGTSYNGQGLVQRWDTQTGGGYLATSTGSDTGKGDKHSYHADTFLNGKLFSATFSGYTVQTFEIDNVYVN
ncbi:glycoside hydrolase [Sapientia aquatica]|uniref:Beta-1,6-galactanase n=1 Tax=Sapientia aquatica TaxID=1549640 RepID=A0A4V3ATL3_9BURK|nr:glycoside hydrolase [Sapientia aquatica]TDK60443.1 beta-1,6-galactanase [Sapientia aquatica]